MAEADPMPMEVAAEEVVRTSASGTPLGGQAPTGVLHPCLSIVNKGHTAQLTGMERPSLPHRKSSRFSDGSRKMWKYTVANRREEATLHPPQLVLHPVPTVGLMPTLHLMATFHLIRSKLLKLNNYPMPIQAVAVGPSFIRINMRSNQSPFPSTPFHRRPIPIQFIHGDRQIQADRLLLPQ